MTVADTTLLFPASVSPVPVQIPLNRNGAAMAFRNGSEQNLVLKRHGKFVKRRLMILR